MRPWRAADQDKPVKNDPLSRGGALFRFNLEMDPAVSAALAEARTGNTTITIL
jgi:hypothetical protein